MADIAISNIFILIKLCDSINQLENILFGIGEI